MTTGTFTLPNFTDLEAATPLFIADTSSGPISAFGTGSGYPVAFAGAEGVYVRDLATNLELAQISSAAQTGPLFGATGLGAFVGADTTDAVFGFGANGSVLGQPGGASQFFPGTTYDAVPAGNDPFSGRAIVVGPNDVSFLERVSGSSLGFDFSSTTFPASAFDGELVSGFIPGGGTDASVLVLSRAVESNLYWVQNGTPDASPLNMGLDARKLRCSELSGGTYLCGVSVFGEDRAAIVNWSGSGGPTLGGSASTGDGPVGIDLHPLPTGTYALSATGFNDNTVTEAEISATGMVLSSQTRAAASGCTNPGHATYIRDALSLKLLYTCYGSDNYVVEESRF